jgi:predicted N-acetyltransferase YhbS
MGLDRVAVSNVHQESGIGQGLLDDALDFDHVRLCQVVLPPLD